MNKQAYVEYLTRKHKNQDRIIENIALHDAFHQSLGSSAKPNIGAFIEQAKRQGNVYLGKAYKFLDDYTVFIKRGVRAFCWCVKRKKMAL